MSFSWVFLEFFDKLKKIRKMSAQTKFIHKLSQTKLKLP